MKLTIPRLMLIALGLLFTLVLATNAILLYYNPNSIQALPESSLIDLAAASESLSHVVFFGAADFYNAEEIRLSPEVMQTLHVDEQAVRRYSGIEEVIVVPYAGGRIEIPPHARVYPRVAGIDITFIPTTNPHLQVLIQDDSVIVTEYVE
jgi:hypothetical protein